MACYLGADAVADYRDSIVYQDAYRTYRQMRRRQFPPGPAIAAGPGAALDRLEKKLLAIYNAGPGAFTIEKFREFAALASDFYAARDAVLNTYTMDELQAVTYPPWADPKHRPVTTAQWEQYRRTLARIWSIFQEKAGRIVALIERINDWQPRTGITIGLQLSPGGGSSNVTAGGQQNGTTGDTDTEKKPKILPVIIAGAVAFLATRAAA